MLTALRWAVPVISAAALAILWAISPQHARAALRATILLSITATALALPIVISH